MKKIAAVIVTYNPDLSNLEALVRSLHSDGVPCFIIDNGSNYNFSSLSFLQNIVVTYLRENEGIAKAQNVGIQKCIAQSFERIIFFDQDSAVEEGFVKTMLTTFDDQDVMIAAPVFYDISKGYGYKIVDIDTNGIRKKMRPEEIFTEINVSVAISSGTVVDVRVFHKAGLMNEELFIDYVDIEWCLRCRASGYLVRINPNATMLHSIGDRSVSFLGFNIPIHSPVRRYYRVRNAFLMLRFSHVPKVLVMREICFGLIHQIIILMNSNSKLEYVRYYIKGCWDGLCGRGGRAA